MNLKNLSLVLIAPLCWGMSFTLAKPAVQHFPPLFLMLMVYSGIAVIMALTQHENFQTPWPQLLLISCLAVTIQGALLFYAVRDVEATTANLVLQTQVPAAVIMGWLIAGEKLDTAKVIGTLIAILGVAIVIGLPENRPPLIPVLMIVLSGFVWAAGQVFARLYSKDSGLMILKANAYYGVPQLLLATVVLEHGQLEAMQTATLSMWMLLLFVGFVGFYLAYATWFSALKIMRVDEVVPFVLLMTPVGLVTAVVFLGETITPVQYLGGGVLMLGLAIVNGLIKIPKTTRAPS